jgi:histidinol-phosphate aminotransferase
VGERVVSALPERRAGIDALRAYRGSGGGAALDLSDNTCRFGVPPAAAAALAAFDPALVTRYPSAANDELREALAEYAGVAADEVVTGCGSDDVLDSALRAFGRPGDRVAFPAPTFVMLEHYARANALEPVPVPPRPGGVPDVDGLLAAGARHVYLCSPNNPTGGVLPGGALERVLAATPGLVILDEAYAEFAGRSEAAAAPARARLLVARTLSKAFGLAGLRVGWAVGARDLVSAVEKARGPYRVSAPAEAAALAALTGDLGWVRAHVADAVLARDRFAAALREAGFAPLPSAANFLLVPVESAAAADRALRARGIAARAFTGLPGIGDALRITVAPWPALGEVLAALRAAVRPAPAGRAA